MVCAEGKWFVILKMSLEEQCQHTWVKHLVNIWLGGKKHGCAVRLLTDCSKNFRPEGKAVAWRSDFFILALLRNSKTSR